MYFQLKVAVEKVYFYLKVVGKKNKIYLKFAVEKIILIFEGCSQKN